MLTSRQAKSTRSILLTSRLLVVDITEYRLSAAGTGGKAYKRGKHRPPTRRRRANGQVRRAHVG
jgi:hypothetical protein